MTSIKELEKETAEYLINHAEEGGTSEFDMSINDISRAKIEAALVEWGQVYLGNVNIYDPNHGKPVKLVKYYGEKVFNFGYSFAIPCDSPELCKMIEDRDNSEYTGTKDDYKRVTEIHNLIDSLGGFYLIWAQEIIKWLDLDLQLSEVNKRI